MTETEKELLDFEAVLRGEDEVKLRAQMEQHGLGRMPGAPRARQGRRGLPAWLHTRQTKGAEVAAELSASCGMTPDMVARPGLCRELEGHTGGVNCIQWEPGGRLLASGSDDKAVMVWDGLAGRRMARIETPHEGNIFSVVWLPGDRGLLTSDAGDCRVCLLDTATSSVTRSVAAHSSRVKRLATAGDSPGIFWSGSENGTVRQWDLQVQVAAGGAVAYFVPGHLPGTEAAFHKKLRPLTSTFLTYSHDGSELLVNLGGEQIYLYDRFALHGGAAPRAAATLPSAQDLQCGPEWYAPFPPHTNGHKPSSQPSVPPLSPAVEEVKMEAGRRSGGGSSGRRRRLKWAEGPGGEEEERGVAGGPLGEEGAGAHGEGGAEGQGFVSSKGFHTEDDQYWLDSGDLQCGDLSWLNPSSVGSCASCARSTSPAGRPSSMGMTGDLPEQGRSNLGDQPD